MLLRGGSDSTYTHLSNKIYLQKKEKIERNTSKLFIEFIQLQKPHNNNFSHFFLL